MKKLREGFSTGSAVAACAAAAVRMLLGRPEPAVIPVAIPPFHGSGPSLQPEKNTRLNIPISYTQRLGGSALHTAGNSTRATHQNIPRTTCKTSSQMAAHNNTRPAAGTPENYVTAATDRRFEVFKAAVIKDGGDDPDATNGMLIEVYAAFKEDAFATLPGVWLELESCLRIKCGPGVGLVTLPGLPVAKGEPAINPHPRKQISYAVFEELARSGQHYGLTSEPATAHDDTPLGANEAAGQVCLYLRIPQGEQKAAHTLNSRLGIIGGVSILGTRGTVRPFSHEAWQATISQGLDIAKSLNLGTICFSTGRRSEQGLQKLHKQLPEQAFVQAADFAKYSITEAAARQFNEIIWGCYCGKLLKLAQGLPYTHARSAPADLPLLAGWAAQCGVPKELCAQIATIPTAQGAFDLLERHSPALCVAVLKKVAKTALAALTAWLSESETTIKLYVLWPDNSLWLKLKSETDLEEADEAN